MRVIAFAGCKAGGERFAQVVIQNGRVPRGLPSWVVVTSLPTRVTRIDLDIDMLVEWLGQVNNGVVMNRVCFALTDQPPPPAGSYLVIVDERQLEALVQGVLTNRLIELYLDLLTESIAEENAES